MGPGTFKPIVYKPGTGIFNPIKTNQLPFVDPNKGVEQFFDIDGDGPSLIDQENWDKATNKKPNVLEKFQENNRNFLKRLWGWYAVKATPVLTFPSKPGRQIINSTDKVKKFLQSTLFKVLVVALIASTIFFFLKSRVEGLK